MIKRLFFNLIILLPVIFGAILFIIIFWRLICIRSIDYSQLEKNVENYLQFKEGHGRVSVSLNNKILNIDYREFEENGPFKRSHREVKFNPADEDFTIYVFGETPLVSRPPDYKGQYHPWPDILEKILNSSSSLSKKIKVYNFGMNGYDSYDIKQLVSEVIKIKKPDLVLYFGTISSDLRSPRLMYIRKEFYFLWNPLMLKRYGPPGIHLYVDWFLQNYFEPAMLNTAQKFGLLNIDEKRLEKIDNKIIAAYRNNQLKIGNELHKLAIPFVVISWCSNLEAKPYGKVGVTDIYYNKGIKEKDYKKRVDLLIQAKQTDFFNVDPGFKLSVYAMIDELERNGIKVFRLKDKLIKERFDFGYKNFYDTDNFHPQVHNLFAGHIADYLKENSLLK